MSGESVPCRAGLSCAAAWAAVTLAVVGVGGEFPTGDDWAYSSGVRTLLEEGRLVRSEFASPAAVVNVLWGALFSIPAGFSHAALRLSTMAGAVLALAALDALLEEMGLDFGSRLLGCALLAVSPLFVALSLTFNTDILFLALFLSALAAFEKARRRRRGWLWGGAAASSLACLSRQVGLAPALAAAIVPPRTALHPGALSLPLLALAGHAAWAAWTQGPTHANLLYRARMIEWWASPVPACVEGVLRCGLALHYMGLTAAPAALGALTRLGPGLARLGRPGLAGLLGAAALWSAALVWKGPLPALGDQLTRRGLGVVPVPGADWKAAGFWASGALWSVLSALSALGLAHLVVAYAGTAGSSRRRGAFLLAAVAGSLAVAPALAGPFFFDRYLLPLLPAAAALACSAATPRRAASWACVAGFGLLSLSGARDFMSWNRAVRDAAARAVSLGYRPEEVMAGLSWEGELLAQRNLDRLKTVKPLEAIRPYEWRDSHDFRALVSFDPRPPGRGARRVWSGSYPTPLGGSGAVYLYGRP